MLGDIFEVFCGWEAQLGKLATMGKIWYNTSPHVSINMTASQALYGREAPHIIRHSLLGSLDNHLQELDAILYVLRAHMLQAHRMKAIANGKRCDEAFSVGDLVYIKLQLYRQKSLPRRPWEKLAAKFYGPYTIVAHIGPAAYKLALPAASKIHPVFHVS